MSHLVTLDNLFKPRPTRTEAKADQTSHTARSLLNAEAERRDAKTARLRQARLQMQAAVIPSDPTVKVTPVKAARRARSSM